MHKLLLIAWPLICATAISSCATAGKVAPPAVCPTLTPPPPSLMQPGVTEKKVRAELFSPPLPPTTR